MRSQPWLPRTAKVDKAPDEPMRFGAESGSFVGLVYRVMSPLSAGGFGVYVASPENWDRHARCHAARVTLDHRHIMDVREPCFRGTGEWQRIYIDLPGHGLSPADADIQSQDNVLNAIREFIDARISNERFVVGGDRKSVV